MCGGGGGGGWRGGERGVVLGVKKTTTTTKRISKKQIWGLENLLPICHTVIRSLSHSLLREIQANTYPQG